ncbi:hypothetical protein V2G26_013016 [Clonostachys chloroleuca]|uniref:Extracellular membrane protein CFEM domain-containing protein n=1 Tax=Clonostachys chloroleuca TaxID=1926264 RepID=A0AA35LZW1_9HYPO|nr:unnamed protein product [Clonostachys chloroleuca]
MKLTIIARLLLASPLVSAQFDTVFALTKALGLTVKFDCALPCILEAANKIPCNGKGPADTICSNIATITTYAKPCAEKCDADRASTFIQELTQYVCKQGVPKSDQPSGADENKKGGNQDKTEYTGTEHLLGDKEVKPESTVKDEL